MSFLLKGWQGWVETSYVGAVHIKEAISYLLRLPEGGYKPIT